MQAPDVVSGNSAVIPKCRETAGDDEHAYDGGKPSHLLSSRSNRRRHRLTMAARGFIANEPEGPVAASTSCQNQSHAAGVSATP